MLRHDLERRMYTLELIKKTDPRVEDLAIRINPRGRRHIKRFATIHTFPEIPTTFFPIVQMIIRSGAIDGSIYGEYGLIPHGGARSSGKLMHSSLASGRPRCCAFGLDQHAWHASGTIYS